MIDIVDISENHIEYADVVNTESFIIDFMSSRRFKRKCLLNYKSIDSYIIIPRSYVLANGKEDLEAFERLIYHADIPENILIDATRQIKGVCFRQPPIINIPDELSYLEDKIMMLAKKGVHESLVSGRFCIAVDINRQTGKPDILFYKSSEIPNWDDSENDELDFVVLSEETVEKQSRVLIQKTEKGILSTRYEADKPNVGRFNVPSKGVMNWTKTDEVVRTGFKGSMLDVFPVFYIEQPPALAGMARTVLKGIRISADYYSMLSTLGTGKLVLSTDRDMGDIIGGHEFGLVLGKGDKAEILQMASDGADVLKTAMNELFEKAVAQGIEIISVGANNASGENLRIQVTTKQLKINDYADKVSTALESALKLCAELLGVNNPLVNFKINVNLVRPPTDIKTLKELREGIDNGLVRRSDYVRALDNEKIISVAVLDDGSKDYAGYVNDAYNEYNEFDTGM